MPAIGIGLHVLIALFFALHAVRSGRDNYWLLVLFLFPLLGSLAYFLAVYRPSTRREGAVGKTVASVARSLDPGRHLRDAQRAFELTPTAQNQLRLAHAFLDSGATTEALRHFEACLRGPFANAPDIRLGAAKARLEHGQTERAIEQLQILQHEQASYRPEQVSLLLAQAYSVAGHDEQARAELISAVSRFGSLEAKVEYAIWALDAGDKDTAALQFREIRNEAQHWSRRSHALNKPLVQRLERAFAASGKL